MQEIRVYFNKTGRAKYISHLDLMRTVTRAIIRAKIPLWYTEGFNPHPFLTFALPLSLGVESWCESFDIRVDGVVTSAQIVDGLNHVLPEGIEVTGTSDLFMKSSDIAYAEYTAEFEFDEDGRAEEYAKNIQSLLTSDELITTKKSKKKGKKVDVEVNLKDYIKCYDIMHSDNTVKLFITLAAGNSKNLNPTVLFERLNRDLSVVPDLTRIKKHRLLTADGKEFK